jgi:hypothetical protein
VESGLESVTKELIEATGRLDELPADAFAERAELRDHIHALQARARDLRAVAGSGLSADQIRTRIGNLESRIAKQAGNHLSASAAAQTGRGGGIEPRDVHRLNRQMDEASGMEGMRRELAALRTELAAIQSNDEPSSH